MNKDKVNYPLHVSQWKETGISMAAYCKSKAISYQSFTYHVSRMKKNDGNRKLPNLANEFIQIDVLEKLNSGIEYHFKNGNYFSFPVGCSVRLIKALIA